MYKERHSRKVVHKTNQPIGRRQSHQYKHGLSRQTNRM